MNWSLFSATTLAALASASLAGATVVYANNFDTENGGAGATALNFTGFTGLSVQTPGTVDLVHTGDFRITCAGGSGACVDLDGSTRQGSTLLTDFFDFDVGDVLTFSFDLSGNQRIGAADLFSTGFMLEAPGVIVGPTFAGGTFGSSTSIFPDRYVVTSTVSGPTFQHFTTSFVAQGSGRARAFLGAPTSRDNTGPIADNLVVDLAVALVPEPAAWSLMILGFATAGGALRVRRARRLVL